MTSGEAARLRSVLEFLEAIPEEKRRPADTNTINAIRSRLPDIDATISDSTARWRGFQHDATFGQIDTAAGVVGGIKSMLGGDGYLSGYREGRDAVRAKDTAAYEANPEAFDSGQMAGSIGITGPTIGFGLPALKGLPLIAKTLIGAAAGAVTGGNIGVQDAQTRGVSTETVADMWREGKQPAAVGGTIGALTYPLAAASGAAARTGGRMIDPPVEGFGRRASGAMAGEFTSAQKYGDDIANYLRRLEPEAMLADAPGMRPTTQAITTMGGDGAHTVSKAMNERAAGSGARISAIMDDAITAPTEAFQRRQAEAAARTSQWGPMYDAAKAAQDTLDVSGVLANMDNVKAGPNTKPILTKYQRALREAAEAAPDYQNWLARKTAAEEAGQAFTEAPPLRVTAEELHGIRTDLSDEAFQARQSKPGTILGASLRDVDELLDTVPGYADARTGWANSKAMDDAVDAGQTALRGGRWSALSPDEFAVDFNKLSDAQKEAFRAGLRRDVAALMGTSRNDAAAAWGEFEKAWSAEKLRIVLGDDAEPILRRLYSESEFSKSRNAALGGSPTAPRQSAVERLGPQIEPATGQQPGVLSRVKRTVFDEPLNEVINSIAYGPSASRANAEVGQMLAATGSERDRIVQELLRKAMNEPRITRNAQQFERIVAALLGSSAGYQSSAVTQQ